MNYRIILFGAGGNGAAHLISTKRNIHVVGFMDNNASQAGTFYCGLPVFSTADVRDLDYDYIFICSSWALDIYSQLMNDPNVDASKVVNYTARLRQTTEAAKSTNNLALVTGNSYAFNAFNSQCFDCQIVNLAMSSQDLKTDFELVKNFINTNKAAQIQYVFLGLYHYCFDYEYTKRTTLCIDDIYSSNKSNHSDIYSHVFTNQLNENIRASYTRVVTQQDKLTGRQSALSRSHKRYEKSRKHNIDILDTMLHYIKQHKITPILTILPMHTAYVQHLDSDHLLFFNDTVKKLATKHTVRVVESLSMKLHDRCFGDVTHLNHFGGYVFSSFLAQKLGLEPDFEKTANKEGQKKR